MSQHARVHSIVMLKQLRSALATFAELTDAQKNRISQRHRAVDGLRKWLHPVFWAG